MLVGHNLLKVGSDYDLPEYVFAAPRFEMLSVDSGSTALERLESANDRYDLIIVDQKDAESHWRGIGR